MATDWQELAKARKLDIPQDQILLLAPTLSALEAAFRKLADTLPAETPSSSIFRADSISPSEVPNR